MKNFNFEDIELKEKAREFTNLELNKNMLDGRFIAVNKKYLAMSWKSNGEIVLADSSKPCKIGYNHPHIKIIDSHYKIQDIEFSPFNDNILALAYDNRSVVLWKITERNKNATKELSIYNKHKDKVNYVTFNPVVDNVLCSSDTNKEIHIWNLEKNDNYITFNNNEISSMISWNPNGDLVGVSPKNKFLKIYDPRNRNMVFNQKINEGYVSSKISWIDNNLLATTGWEDKNGSTMLKIWDLRKSLNGEEIYSIKINETRRNISIPFINKDLKIIYAFESSKDRPKLYLFNYNENEIKKVKEYNLNEAFICSALINREILDKKNKEIDRFAICSNSEDNKNIQNISYSSFYLPKQSEISDSILYPDKDKKILSYEEWIEGKNPTIFENNNNKETVNENDNNNDKNEFKNINKNEQTEKIINEKDKKIENGEKNVINEVNNENNKLYNDLLNKN